MLFAVAFLIEFTIGGLSGVAFAAVPVDWQVTDTYFVVAHIHYVLFGGTVFSVLAAMHYWFPKISGRMLDEKLGRWSFWLIVLGFNTAFFVQHFLGLMGMPRRVYTYPNLPWFGALNIISTTGAAILVFGILLFCANIAMSLIFGTAAGDDPWNAWTLEWAASSPPSLRNFTEIPEVRSRRPLWDRKHPDAARLDAGMNKRAQLAMAMFLMSSAVFFFLLILAFKYFAPLPSLNSRGGWLLTALLLAASLSIWRRWRWIATALGVAFVAALFATISSVLTAIHGLFVVAGIISIAVVPGSAMRTVALYWYFFTAVWLVIFVVSSPI